MKTNEKVRYQRKIMQHHLDALSVMFPAHTRNFLETTLATHDGDVEKTVEYLLGESTETDSRLAQALLLEMATQWESETKQRIPDDIRSDAARLETFLRQETGKKSQPNEFAKLARSTLHSTKSLSDRALGGMRDMMTRLTASRATTSPIFHNHMTEPMLSPLDTDRDNQSSSSHC